MKRSPDQGLVSPSLEESYLSKEDALRAITKAAKATTVSDKLAPGTQLQDFAYGDLINLVTIAESAFDTTELELQRAILKGLKPNLRKLWFDFLELDVQDSYFNQGDLETLKGEFPVKD